MERERIDFGRSPTRCPYCHADVLAEERLALCRACAAKHHAECWDQLGRCGACGGERALQDPKPSPTRPALFAAPLPEHRVPLAQAVAQETPLQRAIAAGVFVLCTLFLVGLIGLMVVMSAFALWRGEERVGDLLCLTAGLGSTLVPMAWASFQSVKVRLGLGRSSRPRTRPPGPLKD